MRKSLVAIGTFASLLAPITPAFAAYSSYYAVPSIDSRRGEHPYEVRKEAQERRIRDYERNRYRRGYSLYDVYTSPARTENLQLHPFFRNQAALGGAAIDPYSLYGRPVYDPAAYSYPRHPSTYCLNYRFDRYGSRTAPTNYECVQ